MILNIWRRPATSDYPIDGPPWAAGVGQPALARLLESRPRRLARLSEHLAEDGIDLDVGLADPGPAPLARALDSWTDVRWRDVADAKLADPARWHASIWDDAAAPLYTQILDLGVALGELAIRHRPTLAWAVYDDPDLEADGDSRYMRVMPLGPYRSDGTGPTVAYDALDEAFMRYQAIAYGQRRFSFLDALTLALDAGKPR